MYIIEYLYITCEDHPERERVRTEYREDEAWMEVCSVWNTSTRAYVQHYYFVLIPNYGSTWDRTRIQRK